MTINANGGLAGGSLTLNKAGLTGLSGAASTITTSVAGGATSLTYVNQGKMFLAANLAAAATPVNDAGSSLAVAATTASGAAFRPLVTQQAITSSGSTAVVTGSACVFVFGYDRLGGLRVAQGKVVPYTDTSANSTICPLPFIPDYITPFSYAVIKLVNTVASSWTFGTSLWNATGVTIDTVVDVMDIPVTDPITA